MIDIIVESESGWQDPSHHRLPNGNGLIEIGERIDDSGDVVEVMMNYYNNNISAEDDGFVYGLRIKDNYVWEYKHLSSPPRRPIGMASDYSLTKNKFDSEVRKFIDTLKEGKFMENNTTKSIYDMCPGLESSIDAAMSRYNASAEKRKKEIEEASQESLKKIDDLYND